MNCLRRFVLVCQSIGEGGSFAAYLNSGFAMKSCGGRGRNYLSLQHVGDV